MLRKESLNSDGQQFHQYQQNEQSSLPFIKCKKKRTKIYDVGNPSPGWGQAQNYVGAKLDLQWQYIFKQTKTNVSFSHPIDKVIVIL